MAHGVSCIKRITMIMSALFGQCATVGNRTNIWNGWIWLRFIQYAYHLISKCANIYMFMMGGGQLEIYRNQSSDTHRHTKTKLSNSIVFFIRRRRERWGNACMWYVVSAPYGIYNIHDMRYRSINSNVSIFFQTVVSPCSCVRVCAHALRHVYIYELWWYYRELCNNNQIIVLNIFHPTAQSSWICFAICMCVWECVSVHVEWHGLLPSLNER